MSTDTSFLSSVGFSGHAGPWAAASSPHPREAGDDDVPIPSSSGKGDYLFWSKHGKLELRGLKAQRANTGRAASRAGVLGVVFARFSCTIAVFSQTGLAGLGCCRWTLPNFPMSWGLAGAHPRAVPVTSSAIFNSSRGLGFRVGFAIFHEEVGGGCHSLLLKFWL